MICSFLHPLKELLKQNFLCDGIDFARPSTINNSLVRVFSFRGNVRGMCRLNVGSKARYNERCDSDFSQWKSSHRERKEQSHQFVNVPLTITAAEWAMSRLFVEHCEAVAAGIDIKRRRLGEQ
jgi:hypothetical protein